MKSFLLIDDHEIVRSGIKTVLLELYKPCEVFEATDEKSTLEKLKTRTYDLAIMDVQMPETDTGGLMEYLKVTYPQLKVLIFSMSAENIYGKRFLKAGAMGFVAKSSGVTELQKAIDTVLNGNIYMSNVLLGQLVSSMNKSVKDNPFDQLSSREIEIVNFLIQGKSITEIAGLLSLATSTVGTYKTRLFEKLNVHNMVELLEIWQAYSNKVYS